MQRPSRFSRVLLESIGDAAAGEVVWRQLHANAIAGEDADEVHAQLAADVCQHLMLVLELDPEHAEALNFLGYSMAERNERLDRALELVQRGYTEEEIAQIWSGNLLRAWREVEEVAARMQAEGGM